MIKFSIIRVFVGEAQEGAEFQACRLGLSAPPWAPQSLSCCYFPPRHEQPKGSRLPEDQQKGGGNE